MNKKQILLENMERLAEIVEEWEGHEFHDVLPEHQCNQEIFEKAKVIRVEKKKEYPKRRFI